MAEWKLADEAKNRILERLDGKKVIFVGNSYTYFGRAVIPKKVEERSQEARRGDRGYFYQLCRAAGAETEVTNWTYGNHGLKDLFDCCGAGRGCDGVLHHKDFKDRAFDYVILQERTGKEITPEAFLEHIDRTTAFFREANPKVEFYFLAQRRLYEWQVDWLSQLKKLPERGITVVEWGAVAEELIRGEVAVPESNLRFNKNSFTVHQSAKDGFHPNLLAGYLTAGMAFSALTGTPAVGQPYDFCTDPAVQKSFDPKAYIKRYYGFEGSKTNLEEIFASPAAMRFLQERMDRVAKEERYRSY